MFTRKLDANLDSFMKEYYKQDSKKPDFLEPIVVKLKKNKENDTRDSSVYLLNIIGLLSQIEDDDKLKMYIMEKLLEEIVIQIVRLDKCE